MLAGAFVIANLSYPIVRPKLPYVILNHLLGNFPTFSLAFVMLVLFGNILPHNIKNRRTN